MNWIKQVRETLELLGEELDILHEFLDGFPFYWTDSSDKEAKALCQRATAAYKNALAAIPGEDPMEKLLKWLRTRLEASSEAAENTLGKRDIVWTKDIPKSLKLLAEYGLRQEDCRLLVEIIGYVEMLGYKSEEGS